MASVDDTERFDGAQHVAAVETRAKQSSESGHFPLLQIINENKEFR